jgi:hypothetical protein
MSLSCSLSDLLIKGRRPKRRESAARGGRPKYENAAFRTHAKSAFPNRDGYTPPLLSINGEKDRMLQDFFNNLCNRVAADQAAVTLGNVDGEIGGLTISDPPTQAEVQALRDKCEELADDVRALSTLVHALRGALVAVGVVKGGA